jgi:hypothetical protein
MQQSLAHFSFIGVEVVDRFNRVFRGRVRDEHFFDMRQHPELRETGRKRPSQVVKGPWRDISSQVECGFALAEAIEWGGSAAGAKYDAFLRERREDRHGQGSQRQRMRTVALHTIGGPGAYSARDQSISRAGC